MFNFVRGLDYAHVVARRPHAARHFTPDAGDVTQPFVCPGARLRANGSEKQFNLIQLIQFDSMIECI